MHRVMDRGNEKKTIRFNNIDRNDFIARLAKLAEDANTFLLLTGHKT